MANHEVLDYSSQKEKEKFVVSKMVVKIGSSTVTQGGSRVDTEFIDDIARQGSILFRSGVKIAIVSSGAVDSGNLLIKNVSNRRTAAFYGQSKLIKEWVSAFERYEVFSGELLVLDEHLAKAKDLLSDAIAVGVPIINGYDALIDTDDVTRQRMVSNDNDRLAGFVSRSIKADASVFLTDVDGVMDADGELINFVDRLEDIEEYIQQRGSGIGGMWGKCVQAHYLAGDGQRSIIANGRSQDVLLRIARGENLGTRFGKGWMIY